MDPADVLLIVAALFAGAALAFWSIPAGLALIAVLLGGFGIALEVRK